MDTLECVEAHSGWRYNFIAKSHADKIPRDTFLPFDPHAGSSCKGRGQRKDGISARTIAAFHAYP